MTSTRRRDYFRAMTVRAFFSAVSIIAAAAGAVLITVFVVVPNVKYRLAVSAMERGEYGRAIDGFSGLGDYRDCLDMTLACINLRDGLSLDYAVSTDSCPWFSIDSRGRLSFASEQYPGGGELAVPQVVDGVVVTEIADGGFSYSPYITSVTLPDTLRSIGQSAFSCCTSLKAIDIPEGVTEIGDNAFQSCIALESAVLPEGLSSTGSGVFKNCISLASVTLPDSVSIISNSMFLNCASLNEVSLGDGVMVIAGLAFSGCSSLETIFLPDSLKYIGSSGFSDCTSLAELTVPEGVTELGRSVFDGCAALKEIYLPASLEAAGDDIFNGCTGLSVIHYAGTSDDFALINISHGGAVIEYAA